MNHPDITRDPPRDRELAARLLAGEGEGREIRDPERLRAAILARAELPLARLRLQPLWWEYAARWARPAVPLALAASLALGYLIGVTPLPGAGGGTAAAASLPFLEEVLTSPVPDAEYELLRSGEGDTDPLLRFALQEL